MNAQRLRHTSAEAVALDHDRDQRAHIATHGAHRKRQQRRTRRAVYVVVAEEHDALARANRDADLRSGALDWLVARKGSYGTWSTTQATIAAMNPNTHAFAIDE